MRLACHSRRLAESSEKLPSCLASMTLEQLSIVFQLVGTLGVIASLIFVGVQIRQNTKTTRVQVQKT